MFRTLLKKALADLEHTYDVDLRGEFVGSVGANLCDQAARVQQFPSPKFSRHFLEVRKTGPSGIAYTFERMSGQGFARVNDRVKDWYGSLTR